jgi:hypothetical protein
MKNREAKGKEIEAKWAANPKCFGKLAAIADIFGDAYRQSGIQRPSRIRARASELTPPITMVANKTVIPHGLFGSAWVNSCKTT